MGCMSSRRISRPLITRSSPADSVKLRQVGIKSDQDVSLPTAVLESAYTPVIETMKNHNSNFFEAASLPSLVDARKEAALQGLTSVKVWTARCSVTHRL